MPYAKHFMPLSTPQSEPLPGMQPNNAGGYAYRTDKWEAFERFLILGAEGGTYYVKERDLVKSNYERIKECLNENYKKAIDMIVDVSTKGRAPKNNPALFALAVAFLPDLTALKDDYRYAGWAFRKVVRTGTHLFMFVHYINALRGWGRRIRRLIESWYNSKDLGAIGFQMAKYQGRTIEGVRWAHRDVLRLAHVRCQDKRHNLAYRWALGKVGRESVEFCDLFSLPSIGLVEKLKRAQTKEEVISLIRENRAAWEFVPGKWLNDDDVWKELLPNMPLGALLRNIRQLGSRGIWKDKKYKELLISRVTSPKYLRVARIHPMSVLQALLAYVKPKEDKYLQLMYMQDPDAVRDRLQIDRDIEAALEQAFFTSMDNVDLGDTSVFLALDVSGSMDWESPIGNITCREAGAAIVSMFVNKLGHNVRTAAFSYDLQPFIVMPGDGPREVVAKSNNLDFGGTDCAAPMLYALKNKIKVDVFGVITDSETWYGDVHPVEALRQYRARVNPDAKIFVLAMTATDITILDPEDPGSLGIVGLDTGALKVLERFVRGDLFSKRD